MSAPSAPPPAARRAGEAARRAGPLALVVLGVALGSAVDEAPVARPLVRDGRRLVRADLHVHTRFSDGFLSPFDVVLAARRHGLDAIAVTEHNVVFPARLASAFAALLGGPTVLVGEEITSHRQHVAGLGLREAIDARQPLGAIVRAIHRQGGVAVACHPVRRYWPAFDGVLGELDATEVVHPIAWRRRASPGAWRAEDLAAYHARAARRGRALVTLGSSDFHFFKMMGLASTWILADDASPGALLRALRAGHAATRGPDGRWYGEPALVASLRRRPPPPRGEAVGYDSTGPLDTVGRLVGWLGLLGLVALRPRRARGRRGEAALPATPLAALGLAALLAAHSAAHAQAQEPPPPPAGPATAASPPRLLDAPELVLPAGAAPLPEGAGVGLELVLDAEGAVTEASVITPLRPDVDAAVLALARHLRFEPARSGGRAVAARIRFRFAVRPPPPPLAPPQEGGAAGPGRDAAAPAGARPSASDAGPPPPPPPSSDPGAEFVATTTGVRVERGAVARVVLAAEELTTVPGTFGEPLRVVATMPGVVRTPFGLGYFLVRGASFENTGFLVDGFPVPLLYHFAAGPAVLSSRLVSRLDFYPGGYPVEHGRFSAGLIALTTAPPPAGRLHLEGEIDLFRASALAVVPFHGRRGSVAVAVRRSYYDLLLPLIVDGVELSYADYQLRADYRVSSRLRASILVFGSDDALDTSSASESGETTATTTSLGTGFHRVIARLSASWPRGARASWAASVGVDRLSASRREPGTSELRSDATATFLGQRLEVELPVLRELRLSLGADAYAWVYGASLTFPTPPGLGEYPRPDFDPQVIDYDASVLFRGLAGWMEAALSLGPFEITPGLRLDGYAYGDVAVVDPGPRLVVRWRPRRGLALKVATGLFTQPPQPFQIERSLGDPTLRPQRSWQSSAGVELSLPASIEVESSVYYSAMSRLARPNDRIELDDGIVTRDLFSDDGRGRSYGLEVLVRRRIDRGLYGWLSYTLSRSERFVSGGDAIPFTFDQTHTLNVAASYRTGGWRFGARFTLASGRPTNEIGSAIYDADADRYRPEYTGRRVRLPVYHQLDVRLDRDFRLGPLRGSVYLDILNVYYADNAEGRLYQFDYRASQPLPGLPILGTLGVRLAYE